MLEIEENYKEKHVARFIAVLSLYSYEINNEVPLIQASKKILSAYIGQDIFDAEYSLDLYYPDRDFLEKIIILFVEKKQEIDELIKSSLIAKWNFDKLDKVIKSVLRLASLELLYHGEIPAKIIIDEYVSLIKCFYENSEAGFVNKVIDTMSTKIRPEEME